MVYDFSRKRNDVKLKETKIYGICRGGFRVELPCNWVVEGRCGADSKPCMILEVG